MIRLKNALTRLMRDLRGLKLDWALIGGLAVSVRAEPRSTRDVDVAVLVEDDQGAEQVVASLTARGYMIETVLEHRDTGRMATVRFRPPGENLKGVIVDLFFASSGVESETVQDAELLEIWPGTAAPVATTAHLLALKVLASRPRDLEDIGWLLENAGPEDVRSARETLVTITSRGYHRDKDLLAIFDDILSRPSSAEPFRERTPVD